MSVQSAPLVTVAIPTKNSGKHLKAALESIKRQDYERVEMIVVDNHSTDDTEEIAIAYGARFFSQGPERSAQMNRAIKEARGEYIYRLDSDCIVEPQLITECVSLCEAGSDMVVIFVKSENCTTFWQRVAKFERGMYRNDADVVGARFIRAALLRAVGGFDENLVAGEDYDLHSRLLSADATVGFANAAELNFDEPASLSEVWKKSVYYGRTFWSYVRKHPDRAIRQTPLRRAFFRNWRSFAEHPILGVGVFVQISVKVVGAIWGGVLGKYEELSRREP